MSIAVRLSSVRITDDGRVGGHDAGATLVRRLLRVFPGAQVVGPAARDCDGFSVVPLEDVWGAVVVNMDVLDSVCLWHTLRLGDPDLGDDFRGPLHSDVPALFVSGTLDGRTPPSNVEELLPGFPNGRHIVIENGEHDYEDLLVRCPALAEAVRAFLCGEPYDAGEPSIPFAFAAVGE